jgi:hypothetical protein
MYAAYFDESGDSGLNASPTTFFVLACVLVHEATWLGALDALIELRRDLRTGHGIATRPEIKGKHFKNSRGVFRSIGWSLEQRMDLYRRLLRYQDERLPIRVFAVAVDKRRAKLKGWESRQAAWTFALQRINRFCGDEEHVMVFPDEGHTYFIRRLMRQMRRFHVIRAHWGDRKIGFPLVRVLEDPNERSSVDSYFVQLADWNAYAAHRSQYVDPKPKVPSDLWDELGATLLLEVNRVRGGPPAIVRYP